MHLGRCRKGIVQRKRDTRDDTPAYMFERRKEPLKFHWIAFRVFAR